MVRGSDDTLGGGDASIAATISAAQADTMGSGIWKPDAAELPRGAEVGRYVVVGQLGAGGMGVVYAAYDPELDRKVALKLLREAGRGTDTTEGSARLLREAQALARLSHPNVVAVHDAGTFGDRVYVAMEHVEGLTLRSWAQTPRGWPELLAVMIAAGRGLAAAHAAGLVHRDVKPDNIMIGVDGRVRVMDFGLARAAGGRSASSSGESLSLSGIERLGSSVTRTGALMGTPAYMAPEQWVGKEADARTDQFAFCVTLWEALFGERPFAGDSLVELAPRVLRGELRTPRAGAQAPGWLRKAAARGLQAEPDRRFPAMTALLAALEHGRTRARRGWMTAGLVGLVVAGIGAGVWRQHDRSLRIAACADAGHEIDAVWHEGARVRLKQALILSGVHHADTTFAKVVPWVDRWTAEWSRVRTQVCEEATVAGTRPLAELTLATACLDERRDELAGLLAVLGDGDPTGVVQAVPAVAGLSQLGPCTDPVALTRRPASPTDADTRDAVGQLRQGLMRVRGLRSAGRHAEGARRAEALLLTAEGLGYRPLEIEARLAFGGLSVGTADVAHAEAALTRAYSDAGTIGADDVAAAAATELVSAVGVLAARHAEGLVWGRSAAMLVARLGQTGTLPGADVDAAVAAVHTLRGAHDAAQPLYERVLAIRERALGAEHPAVATVLNNLAAVHRARGDHATAQALLERVLAIREHAFGPDNPMVATALSNLAAIHYDRKAYDEIQPLLERALPIQEKALGANHPDVGFTLGNLAAVLLERHEPTRATALFERSLAIQEHALGPDHPDVAASVHNLAVVHARLGDHATAVALHRRALEARVKALGSDHLDVLQSLDNLAHEHRHHGELAEAAALAGQALALRERTLPPGHTDIAWSLEIVAQIAMARGEPATAQPLLERALAIRVKAQAAGHPELALTRVLLGEVALTRGHATDAVAPLEQAVAALSASADASPTVRADAKFALARALGRRQARARVLAREAADGYRATGSAGAAKLQAVTAWL
jgi:eukaryotic-like serine/threonine-protein kinase